jgi:hypothetical protein
MTQEQETNSKPDSSGYDGKLLKSIPRLTQHTPKKSVPMNKNFHVDCIVRSGGKNFYDGISHVGGKYFSGKRWNFDEATAIDMIDRQQKKFFVSVQGKTVAVIVADRNGRKYLRTKADSEMLNNLLFLPDCDNCCAESVAT